MDLVNEREHQHLRDERERLRNANAELFAQVTAILARHDLMDLVRIGAPEDEYEPEVGTILPRLRDAADAEDVHESSTRSSFAGSKLRQRWLRGPSSLRRLRRFGDCGVASDRPVWSKTQGSFRNTGPVECPVSWYRVSLKSRSLVGLG
jgi:hypothetical protein